MAKAIEQTAGGLTIGHAALGERAGVAGSVRQEVHDGDTIHVRADGNFGVRFLGVDTPEISFQLPKAQNFTGMGHARWEEFLSSPFRVNPFGRFSEPLNQGLRDYLEQRVGPGTAANHYQHALAAEDALEEEVQNDIAALGQTNDDFRFFLAFATEVIDRYGRFLCYINRQQDTEPRPLTYNERMLARGFAEPYFIWPNINPFRKQPSLLEAVPKPGTAARRAARDSALNDARQAVKNARANGLGIFNPNHPNGPLRLSPFELRFLARRSPPNRWVIDLSQNDDRLIRPQEYHTIPNAEDRLYIPEEYVALFRATGWKIGRR